MFENIRNTARQAVNRVRQGARNIAARITGRGNAGGTGTGGTGTGGAKS